MNGVTSLEPRAGMPATLVLRLSGQRPCASGSVVSEEAGDALLAAVTHPPRVGAVRPIAALLPDVLARYGLAESSTATALDGPLDCYA